CVTAVFFILLLSRPPIYTLFPYTTLFRSLLEADNQKRVGSHRRHHAAQSCAAGVSPDRRSLHQIRRSAGGCGDPRADAVPGRSHMSRRASVAEVLNRLTALSQELAGAFRPVTIVEIIARVLTEQLAPGRLSIML